MYTSEEILNEYYKLEKTETNSKKGKILKKINQHKIITTLMLLFLTFSIINCILIYSFMGLLKNI